MNYPHPVSGRVSEDTKAKLEEAEKRFGVKDGTLVRMALEDYMPRYLANQGKPQHAELFAKLSEALDANPALETELLTFTRKTTRRRRAA